MRNEVGDILKLNHSIRRFFILSKRLFYKKSFVAILLLVPILVCAVGIAARNGDSGIVTVSLAMEDSEDRIAQKIVSELMEENSLIRFVRCGSCTEARRSVEIGEADAAWIFRNDLDERIEKFTRNTHPHNAFVTVIQREDSIFLKLSHEKLNSVIYPYISVSLFSRRVEDNLSEPKDEAFEDFYRSVNAEGEDLFEFVYASENTADEGKEFKERSFLLSPLRGLLAIMVVLGGMAAAMFCMQDEANGVFDRFSQSAGFSFSVVYHASAVVMVGAAVFASLLLTGISVGWAYELLVMTVYCFGTVGFCLCLRLILPDIRLFGTTVPILVVGLAVFCPVLVTVPDLPVIQYLLPTYYYLKAFSNANFVWYMVIYSIVLYAFAFLLHILRAKQLR